MASPVVEGFAFDERNEAKIEYHGLDIALVLSVLDNRYTIRPNRKWRTASHLIIGWDRQGRCIAVPIEPTPEPGIWRPVTAWFCKPGEQALLPKRQ